MPRFSTRKLAVRDRIATITRNRPERLNAVDDRMPAAPDARSTWSHDVTGTRTAARRRR
ncbi:MAG: hypothetical protein MUC32_00485 [Burkholderiaceae bacterium]|nr:hypothetical protein [Burkholderiaceae bacterium]